MIRLMCLRHLIVGFVDAGCLANGQLPIPGVTVSQHTARHQEVRTTTEAPGHCAAQPPPTAATPSVLAARRCAATSLTPSISKSQTKQGNLLIHLLFEVVFSVLLLY